MREPPAKEYRWMSFYLVGDFSSVTSLKWRIVSINLYAYVNAQVSNWQCGSVSPFSNTFAGWTPFFTMVFGWLL